MAEINAALMGKIASISRHFFSPSCDGGGEERFAAAQRAGAGDADARNALVKQRAGEERLHAAADQVIDHRRRLEKFERCGGNEIGPHAAHRDHVAHQHGGEDVGLPQAEADQDRIRGPAHGRADGDDFSEQGCQVGSRYFGTFR